jgi:hypothetical protein
LFVVLSWELEQLKLLDTQSRASENGAKRSAGHFTMVGHDDPAVWRLGVAKHHMTAALSIQFVSGSLQGSHHTAARDHRQPRH